MADDLATRVKMLRSSARLTQQQLGDAIGVSRQTIWNWEHGASQVPSADLPKLAAAFGITVADLYSDDPSKREHAARGSVGLRARSTGIRQEVNPTGIESNEQFGNVSGRLEDLRQQGWFRRPIYRWGAMGDPLDEASQPDPDRLDFPPLGREALVGIRGFGVEVRGDSMEGRGIHDGDICWVNPDRGYRVNGVVLALVTNDDGESGMVVKTYARTEMGDRLISDTGAGRTPVLCQEFRIIGPVVLVSPRPFAPQ